ncbi:hypothetical protein ACS0TY_004799 [Phlomoides rotata]
MRKCASLNSEIGSNIGSQSTSHGHSPRVDTYKGLSPRVVVRLRISPPLGQNLRSVPVLRPVLVDTYNVCTVIKAVQGGIIGITNMSGWYVPFSDTQADKEAALRAVDFQWGWFTAPVVNGDYPVSMRERVGSRLPTFTPEEEILVKGSFDFIGMNYYTTYYAKNDPIKPQGEPTYLTDQGLTTTAIGPDNKPIGEQAASEWLYIVPSGIQGLLNHNATTYGNPNVYITENGVDEKNARLPISEAIKDEIRIKFHQDHLFFMKKAIEEDHVKLKGYMLWSLFDNFEWSEGYTVRFGMYYVDYVNGLIRYPKNSAIWYMNFLNKNPQLPSIKRQVVEEADAAAVKRKRTRN